jgi:hypothetical protein
VPRVAYLHERAEQSGEAPQEDPECHDGPSAVPVAQVAEQWCENHVADDKCSLQQTAFVVADIEVLLDVFQHTCQQIEHTIQI